MSRTTRIKNNYRENRSYSWLPRNITGAWKYEYVNGALIDADPAYDYLIPVNDTDKRAIWKEKRYHHADGKAAIRYHTPTKWVFNMFNKINRRTTKIHLKELVKGNYEDVVLPTPTRVPYAYW